jgi:hypothetical protein
MTILNATLTNPDFKDVTEVNTGIRTLGCPGREYQLEVLKKFEDSNYNTLTQPSGSGKSFEQAALAIADIFASDFTRKQLILVPQNHIAANFFRPKAEPLVFKIAGETKTYSAAVLKEFNFTETPSVDNLCSWLLAGPADLAAMKTGDNETGGMIAMTTYHAFALAFGRMSPDERVAAVRNLHVRPDESHHVAMGEEENEDDQNKVGAILTSLMEHDNNCGITLSTATNFRGDDKCILRPEVLDTFTKYRFLFIDNFKKSGIEQFDVEIVETKTNPTDDIVARVCAEKNEKHIIAVPPRNAAWRALIPSTEHDRSHGINNLVAEIKKNWPGCRIKNLVFKEEQKKNKKHILGEPQDGDGSESQIDVVITCMVGREGTDWVPASRLHVSYVEGSITLSVQTLGRISRRFKGKTKIAARYYFPKFPEPTEKGMTVATLLQDRRNALLFMTQVDDMFFPIVLDELPRSAEPIDGAHPPATRVTLAEIIGEKTYIEMKADFFDQVFENQLIVGSDLMRQTAEEIVLEYHVPVLLYQRAVAALMAAYLRRTPKYKNVDVEFIRENGGAYLLKPEDNPYDFDVTQMEANTQIATTEYDKLVSQIKAYDITIPEELKKLPVDLRKFARQTVRRIGAMEAKNLLSNAAGGGQ